MHHVHPIVYGTETSEPSDPVNIIQNRSPELTKYQHHIEPAVGSYLGPFVLTLARSEADRANVGHVLQVYRSPSHVALATLALFHIFSPCCLLGALGFQLCLSHLRPSCSCCLALASLLLLSFSCLLAVSFSLLSRWLRSTSTLNSFAFRLQHFAPPPPLPRAVISCLQ